MSLGMNISSLVIGFGLILVYLLLHCQETYGKEFIVGDKNGWGIYPGLYTWPNDKKFTPGDVLVFKYNKTIAKEHGGTVIAAVDERAYKDCDSYLGFKNEYTSGNDRVVLEDGPNYFISGACYRGLKLKVCAEYDGKRKNCVE